MTMKIAALPDEFRKNIQKMTKGCVLKENCTVHQYPNALEIAVQGIDKAGRNFCKIFFRKMTS